MRKLLLLAAAFLAFKGTRGAVRSGAISRLSAGELLSVLLAPRWLRLPMLARMFVSSGRKPAPRQRR